MFKTKNILITTFFVVTLCINPLTTNNLHHIETRQLICNKNQLTGFYIIGNTGR